MVSIIVIQLVGSTRLFLFLGLTLFVSSIRVQFTQPTEAYNLLKVLLLAKRDTNLVNRVVEFGHFYVDKQGEEASYLDSPLLLSWQAFSLSHSFSYLKGQEQQSRAELPAMDHADARF